MAIRPIDIARRFNISTTTLRKYEELGLIPPVSRTAAGYRVYTKEHIAYLICVREMMAGFDLSQIAKLMQKVLAKKADAALWMACKAQADLYQEKVISEKILLSLKPENMPSSIAPDQDMLSINDVKHATGVSTHTIRYWDKIGLISSTRSTENNYRIFTSEAVKQILTIYALKFVYKAKGQKHFIRLIKEELKSFDYEDGNRLKDIKNDIEKYLAKVNRAQISSITALHHLCIQVEMNHFDN
jgi:DNA-binding transcriptional MerR regulator